MRKIPAILAGMLVPVMLAAAAHAGPVDKARDAVDPDCSVGKAVKGGRATGDDRCRQPLQARRDRARCRRHRR